MSITIIGAGNIGGTLGQKWALAGQTVTFGVRDPQAPKIQTRLAATNHLATATDPQTAVTNADIILWAIPGTAMSATVADLAPHLDHKIHIDATNNVNQPTMNNLDLLRQHAPNASLYRAFSNLGWENFAEPTLDDTQIDLFFCGAEAEKTAVANLINLIGLRPIYIGDHDQAPLIDNLTRLWFALVWGQEYPRQLAFKLLGA
ncbi:MAG TPA: NAD(P)-binding domain-containing protein [Anaerolineae bacterium]|nr:NAD(P)-binding domain-containing protein [Anaerolineae bacterium]